MFVCLFVWRLVSNCFFKASFPLWATLNFDLRILVCEVAFAYVCVGGTVDASGSLGQTRTQNTDTHTSGPCARLCFSPCSPTVSSLSLSLSLALSLSPQPRTRAVFTKRDVIAILQNKPFIQTSSPPPPPPPPSAPTANTHASVLPPPLSPSLSLFATYVHTAG